MTLGQRPPACRRVRRVPLQHAEPPSSVAEAVSLGFSWILREHLCPKKLVLIQKIGASTVISSIQFEHIYHPGVK